MTQYASYRPEPDQNGSDGHAFGGPHQDPYESEGGLSGSAGAYPGYEQNASFSSGHGSGPGQVPPYEQPYQQDSYHQSYPQGSQIPPPYQFAGYSYGGGYGPYRIAETSQNAVGGWALGLGIASWFCCWVGALVAIGAIVCGVIGLYAAQHGRADNKGMSIAGLVLGLAYEVFLAVLLVFDVGHLLLSGVLSG